jgi:hypothetical protein
MTCLAGCCANTGELYERIYAPHGVKRGSHRSVPQLKRSIQSWIDTWNQDPRPFVWTKTADEILDTIASYCQRINDSGH